eukprot:SAG31_NODE_7169_length_1768_cov_1.416417_1_plen_349_part_00
MRTRPARVQLPSCCAAQSLSFSCRRSLSGARKSPEPGAGRKRVSGRKSALPSSPLDRFRQRVHGRTAQAKAGAIEQWAHAGGRALAVLPVFAVVASWAEERFYGSTSGRTRIIALAKWAFDDDGTAAADARASRHARCAAASAAQEDMWDDLGGTRPSVLRRVGSWVIDMAVVFGARVALALPMQFVLPLWVPMLVLPGCGTVAWSTRDLWLASYGAQSPGRWMMSQEVVALVPPSINKSKDASQGAVGDSEIWATICLNTAVAGAIRVILPTTNLILALGSEFGLGIAPKGAPRNVVATISVATQGVLVMGIVVGLPFLTFSQLLFDPRGRLWTDRIANTQVLDRAR